MNKKQSIGLCSLLLTSVIANANVSGTVYKDLPLNGIATNTYGKKDSNEKGVAGITVTAYSDLGTKKTTTDANGSWSLDSAGKVKVEFTNIPSYLKESAGQSSVQFIDGDSSSVDLALYNPAEYTDANGSNNIAMTIQPNSALNADKNPSVALKILSKDEIPVTNNDLPNNNDGDIPFNKLGSVWGLAYDSANKTLYASAVVRRHSELGTLGTGGIYKIDSNGNIEPFVTVKNTGTINNNRNLSNDTTQPSHDPIFDEVGRVGLGDIDISTDGTKLYTINLNTNQLVEIDIKSKEQKAYDIGNPFSSCPNNDVKSWGIGQNNGKVYVGSVCTTSTAEGAYISEFNGSSFTPFHHIPLDMDGETSLYSGDHGLTNNGKRWRTWITNPKDLFDGSGTRASLAAPILSDIIFDENKGMILGFSDRTALQAGVYNYSPDVNDNHTYKYDAAGDIYKVCKTDNGYINEGKNGCPIEADEFFNDDEWQQDGKGHKEIALGGLAYVQGLNTIASTAFDPVDKGPFNSSGIIWMNTKNGTRTAAQRMVGGYGNEGIRYNGKAGGIGDLEILTASAPTEIGDRVWFDENKNCVQDANESGIAGVKVNLYESTDCTGAPVETATTDENGRYLFPVDAGKNYSVCINNVDGQSVLEGKKLTCNTKGSSINNSDATLADKDAKIAVTPLTTGANNHSFDFGFVKKEADTPAPVVVVPVPEPTPVPEQNNSIDDANKSCDCNSYTKNSTPALNIWSATILITLTSFMAFLFRKELEQTNK